MKRLLQLIFAAMVISLSAQAQETGMKFEHGKTWKAILAKAKAENKYIFVDCYTTWCGPCKFMSAKIFPLEEVGRFYNDKFINAKFQLDTTAKDDDDIKALYADAAFLMKEYKVNVFPTYLFFNSDGQLVHRELGSSPAAKFIEKGNNALNPDKQYYTQLKKYKAGEHTSVFLKNLTRLALNADDNAMASTLVKEYFPVTDDLLSTDNMKFIFEITEHVKDTGFSLMINNLSQFESVIDKNKLHGSLASMIKLSELYINGIVSKNWDNKKWDAYSASLYEKYPVFASEVLFKIKLANARYAKRWDDFANEIDKYLVNNVLSDYDLNENAWLIFQRCDDVKVLEKALVWSKKSFADSEETKPNFIDTYANLLHKMGKTQEAIVWEEKAQAFAGEENRKIYAETITKMKKGEKTW